MRMGPHHHPCSLCGTKTECCGDIEQNYDGLPEWICREYHTEIRREMVVDTDFVCDGCYQKQANEEQAVA